MSRFHSYIAERWKQEIDVNVLDNAFARYIKSGIDLTVLEKYSPQFSSKPSINEDGHLQVKGKYTTKPDEFFFDYQYTYEGLGWKLMGINIQVK